MDKHIWIDSSLTLAIKSRTLIWIFISEKKITKLQKIKQAKIMLTVQK